MQEEEENLDPRHFPPKTPTSCIGEDRPQLGAIGRPSTSTPKISKSKQQELESKRQLELYRQAQRAQYNGGRNSSAPATYTPTAAASTQKSSSWSTPSPAPGGCRQEADQWGEDHDRVFSQGLHGRSHMSDGGDDSNPIVLDDTDEVTNNDSANSSSGVLGPNAQTRCGACDLMGHSRTFRRCPKYYTEAEQIRRKNITDRRKAKTEEEKRQREEVVQTLRQQEQALANQFEQQAQQLQQQREQMLGGINRMIEQVDKKKAKKKKK